MKKLLFFVGFVALVLFLSAPFLKGETLPTAKVFLGKWEFQWEYTGGQAWVHPVIRGKTFRWKASMDVREVSGQVKVIYKDEQDCPELNISKSEYVCDGVLQDDDTLSFSFDNPKTGYEIKLKFKKTPDGILGLGRIVGSGGSSHTINMKHVD